VAVLCYFIIIIIYSNISSIFSGPRGISDVWGAAVSQSEPDPAFP